MAIDFEMSVRPLIHIPRSCYHVKQYRENRNDVYLVDNKLYFSAAMYPQRNKDIAAGISSFSASGCKHGTVKTTMIIMGATSNETRTIVLPLFSENNSLFIS